MKKNLLLICLLMFCNAGLLAQRLPGNAVPNHYQLSYAPDLKNATFNGDETIDLTLKSATNNITLNSAEIDIRDASITQAGKTQNAKVSYDVEKEQATLSVDSGLTAGAAKIHIVYNGILNDQLRGFYLSKSEKRNYAVTQMEATDARRAFPGFDEPAYKSTFDISLIIDKNDIAISNGAQISDTPGPGDDKHTVKFQTTAKMSTYLVAMVVGDFKCVSGEVDQIALRVCSTPERANMLGHALESTKHIVHYMNAYYGITYPYGKLDQVGIPDFAAGAMENTGLITYRETDMLVDPKTGSEDERKNVAGVVSHEIAHQWFGDLVTMKWWDDIWLNEGFATWMANKPLNDWKPEWNTNLDDAQETGGALGLDGLGSTRAIHANASTPAEISQLFDGIAYGKTAAVLRMIESFTGEKPFQDGVHSYLKKYSYQNTAAEDFWNEIATVTHKPVDKVMPTFVNQAGAPLLQVKAACEGQKTKVSISQERFFVDPALAAKGSPEIWQVPVCIKMPNKAGGVCKVLTQKQEDVMIDGCFQWVFANAGGKGYYRTQYNPAMRAKFVPEIGTALRQAERVRFVNDEWAMVNSNRQKIGGYLDLASGLKNETYFAVLDTFLTRVNYISDKHLAGDDKKKFAAWVRGFLQPFAKKLGMVRQPTDNPNLRSLRNLVLSTLANHEDPAVLAHFKSLVEAYIKDPATGDPDQLDSAIFMTARHGDAALYDRYLEKMRASTNEPSAYYRYMGALTAFTDPSLVQKTMALGISGEVRTQDLFRIWGGLFDNKEIQKDVWNYYKSNFDTIQERTKGGLGSGQTGVTSAFCDHALRDEAKEFFEKKNIPGSERTLKQSLEAADTCIRFHDSHFKEITDWLGKRSSSK